MKIKSSIEWTLDQDYHTGAFSWNANGVPFTIWATPYWDLGNGVSVQITSDNGEELHLETIGFETSESDKQLWVDANWSNLKDSQTMKDYLGLMESNLNRLVAAGLKGAFDLLEKHSKASIR